MLLAFAPFIAFAVLTHFVVPVAALLAFGLSRDGSSLCKETDGGAMLSSFVAI